MENIKNKLLKLSSFQLLPIFYKYNISFNKEDIKNILRDIVKQKEHIVSYLKDYKYLFFYLDELTLCQVELLFNNFYNQEMFNIYKNKLINSIIDINILNNNEILNYEEYDLIESFYEFQDNINKVFYDKDNYFDGVLSISFKQKMNDYSSFLDIKKIYRFRNLIIRRRKSKSEIIEKLLDNENESITLKKHIYEKMSYLSLKKECVVKLIDIDFKYNKEDAINNLIKIDYNAKNVYNYIVPLEIANIDYICNKKEALNQIRYYSR